MKLVVGGLRAFVRDGARGGGFGRRRHVRRRRNRCALVGASGDGRKGEKDDGDDRGEGSVDHRWSAWVYGARSKSLASLFEMWRSPAYTRHGPRNSREFERHFVECRRGTEPDTRLGSRVGRDAQPLRRCWRRRPAALFTKPTKLSFSARVSPRASTKPSTSSFVTFKHGSMRRTF